MATRKYKLAHGNHKSGPKGKRYTQGDIIESEVDLVAKHGSKFEYATQPVAIEVVGSPSIAKSVEDEGRFDVLNKDGVITNDKSMTKKQAIGALALLIADSMDDDDDDDDDGDYDEDSDQDDDGE